MLSRRFTVQNSIFRARKESRPLHLHIDLLKWRREDSRFRLQERTYRWRGLGSTSFVLEYSEANDDRSAVGDLGERQFWNPFRSLYRAAGRLQWKRFGRATRGLRRRGTVTTGLRIKMDLASQSAVAVRPVSVHQKKNALDEPQDNVSSQAVTNSPCICS